MWSIDSKLQSDLESGSEQWGRVNLHANPRVTRTKRLRIRADVFF